MDSLNYGMKVYLTSNETSDFWIIHLFQVEAYDYSQSFVDMLLKVKSDENLTNLTAYQGDAHKQQDTASCKKFDLILGCNLIDRLHTPKDWVLQSKVSIYGITIIFLITKYSIIVHQTHYENHDLFLFVYGFII